MLEVRRRHDAAAALLSLVTLTATSLLLARFTFRSMVAADGSTFTVLFAAETTASLVARLGSDLVATALLRGNPDGFAQRVRQSRSAHFLVGGPVSFIVYTLLLLIASKEAPPPAIALMFFFGLVEGRCNALADMARSVGWSWRAFAYYYGGFRLWTFGPLLLLGEFSRASTTGSAAMLLCLSLVYWLRVEFSIDRGFEPVRKLAADGWLARGPVVAASTVINVSTPVIMISFLSRGETDQAILSMGVLAKVYTLALGPAMLCYMLVSRSVAQTGPISLQRTVVRAWTTRLAALGAAFTTVGLLLYDAAATVLRFLSDERFELTRWDLARLLFTGSVALVAVPLGLSVASFGQLRGQILTAVTTLGLGVVGACLAPGSPSSRLTTGLLVTVVARWLCWRLVARLSVTTNESKTTGAKFQ